MKILLAKLGWKSTRRKCHDSMISKHLEESERLIKGISVYLCVFLLALCLTDLLAYDTSVLFPLPKIATTQAYWSVQLLLCWRSQGVNWRENPIDLLCVLGKKRCQQNGLGTCCLYCSVFEEKVCDLSTKWGILAPATSPEITRTCRVLFHLILSVPACKQIAF